MKSLGSANKAYLYLYQELARRYLSDRPPAVEPGNDAAAA